MPAIPINSIDDPRILPFRDLPRSRLAKQSGRFIAEGAWLVERLLASEFTVDSLFVERPRVNEYVTQVPEEVPIYVADKQLLQEVLGFKFHRCVMASGWRQPNRCLDDLMSKFSPEAIVVVCHDVCDSENMGGILRNCAAFGVDAVLLGPHCADPFSRRALRVSMGGVFKLAITESDDLATDLVRLRDEWQFELVAAVLNSNATPLESARRSRRTALLLGNEEHGVDETLFAQCDQGVTIPMRLGTDSLNVAVASGIILYHLTRESNRQE